MPEHVRGLSSTPSRRDSEQWIYDMLARQDAQIEQLVRAVAELAVQLAQVKAALQLAVPSSPAHPTPAQRGRRRGDTILRVVQAVVITAIGLGVILAACGTFTPHARPGRCTVACARAASHHGPRRDIDA